MTGRSLIVTLNLFLSTHHSVGSRDWTQQAEKITAVHSLKKWQTTGSPLDGSVHKPIEAAAHSTGHVPTALPASAAMYQHVMMWLFYCAQIHRTLFHHHAALLILPRLFWGWSFLPGPHGHRGWEAAHPGRSWHLVVCRLDPAHHWRPDAQRLQQLVHILLSVAAECDWGHFSGRSYQLNTTSSGGLASSRCCGCESVMIWSWLVLRGFSSSAVRHRSPGTSWGLLQGSHGSGEKWGLIWFFLIQSTWNFPLWECMTMTNSVPASSRAAVLCFHFTHVAQFLWSGPNT